MKLSKSCACLNTKNPLLAKFFVWRCIVFVARSHIQCRYAIQRISRYITLRDIARQAASDRAKIGHTHKTAVALYYIARKAGSDLRLTCGRHALSNKAT
jgi:hypothetical protein